MSTPYADLVWDVVVVGAGPAGASAARTAAAAGARVLLLDKASFPRYKTCGGGITGAARRALADDIDYQLDQSVTAIAFTHRMGKPIRRTSSRTVLEMVQRSTFDQQNVNAAVNAGATFRDQVNVQAIEQDAAAVRLRTTTGPISARVVVGADGTGGRTGRYVGVQIDTVDLGLEVEVSTPAGYPDAATARLDWGKRAGSYAWVFPKQDSLSVGVIEAKGSPEETKDYLQRWMRHLGLAEVQPDRESGHLTQWRKPGSPLRRGDVIVAGETAGLLEPWTREGISFALRSGTWAGNAAAAAAAGDESALESYVHRVTQVLEPEMAAGTRFLRLFERRPELVQLAVARIRLGSRYFFRYCRGEVTLRDTLHRHWLGAAIALSSRRAPRLRPHIHARNI